MRTFHHEESAYAYCRKLNAKLHSRVYGPNQGKRDYTLVLSDGEYQATLFEDFAPKGFPERKPHYE